MALGYNYPDDWWDADGDMVGTRLFEAVSAIDGEQGGRRFANVIYNRLATGRDLPNVYGLSMSRRTNQAFSDAIASYQPPSVNVAAMSVESMTAKVGRNRPWLMFTTTGADWRTMRRARLLSRYVDGIFWKSGFWDILPDLFRDMLTFVDGMGVVKWFAEGKQIRCERVIPEEILVNGADAVHGRPRSLYQRTFAAKAALMARFPERAEKIRLASGAHPGLAWAPGENVPEQFAPVVDAWHLAEGDKPGRHVYMVGDSVIKDEPWQGGFPFGFLRGYPLGSGFFRQGIVEQLVPYQHKLDRIERVIDEAGWRMGTPKWFSQKGNNVDATMLIAKVATVVEHALPNHPVRDTGPMVSPEWYNERQTWIRLAFDRVGLSQDSVTGTKPDGLNSGEAQRVHSQITSIRQSILAQALEGCVVESGNRVLDLARELKPSVNAPGRRGLRLIDWNDAKLDPDGFIMKAFPISSLPAEPAGRIQRANEMLQMGTIDKGQYARLLGNPDVEQATSGPEAARDCIDAMLDGIVDDDNYDDNAPEKYMPLDLALQLGVSRYLRERSLGAPDDVLENLSRWIEEVRDMSAPPEVTAPASAMSPPGIQQISAPDVMPAPAMVPQIAPPMPAAA